MALALNAQARLGVPPIVVLRQLGQRHTAPDDQRTQDYITGRFG